MNINNAILYTVISAGLLFACKTKKTDETKNSTTVATVIETKDTTPPPSFVTA
jgi:hypothetical protein